MNRLDFFKWLGKGAAAVAAAPLVKYLPKAVPTTVRLVSQKRVYGSPFTAAEYRAFKPDWIFVTKDSQPCETWLVPLATLHDSSAAKGDEG